MEGSLTPDRAVVGFIGLGVMGGSMARNLHRAGYKLHVYNRSRAKAEEMVRLGSDERTRAVMAQSNATFGLPALTLRALAGH